jgi:hypothetical protein
MRTPIKTIYTETIQAATGCDPDTAALIEDVMRCDRTALDHLTREQIQGEAREILDALMADPAAARLIAEASELPVPAFAAA